MNRNQVIVVAALCAVLLGGGMSSQSNPHALPHVSLAPPASDESESVSSRVLAELRSRHTGLSDREIAEVARTLLSESERHGVDPELMVAVMLVESGGYNFAVSSVGARGLMQLMPATGEELARVHGLHWSGPDSLFDPVLNVTLGVAYLKQLSDRFESWPIALAAYNWGPNRIDRRIRRGGDVPSLYIRQVMRFYEADEVGASS